MKIAITGAKGIVGSAVVKHCAERGYQTVQIDLTEFENDYTPNSETRVADTAGDYDSVLSAFQGCDAVIHLAAIPNPVNHTDAVVHANNVNSAFNGFRAAGELGIKRVCYASSVKRYRSRLLESAAQPFILPYRRGTRSISHRRLRPSQGRSRTPSQGLRELVSWDEDRMHALSRGGHTRPCKQASRK